MMQDIHAQRILILDFGSQYTQLIARRVREIGVYCEICAYDMKEEAIREISLPNSVQGSDHLPLLCVLNWINHIRDRVDS